MTVYGRSDVGSVRTNNEDALLIAYRHHDVNGGRGPGGQGIARAREGNHGAKCGQGR